MVASHRQRLDTSAAWGVPAHVTVLYPFMEPAALSADIVDQLRAAIGRTSTFRCAFGRTNWYDRDVLWLEPDPSEVFRSLTAAVVNAFPDYQPYGGAFGSDTTPHLTVAEARLAETPEDLVEAERQVLPLLPVEAEVAEALLIAGTTAPKSWGLVARLPLGVR